MSNNIYTKLLNIQSKLKAPKSQFNSFGKYNYRSCEDILEALKPLLVEEKATIMITDEVMCISDRFYVKANIKFIDVETGETLNNSALAREDETKKGQDLCQVTGSTSSYARKYALNGLFCIDDTKDSDTTNTDEKSTITENQIKRLYAIGNKANITPAQIITVIKKEFNKVDVKKLTKAEYDSICERLENKQ